MNDFKCSQQEKYEAAKIMQIKQAIIAKDLKERLRHWLKK